MNVYKIKVHQGHTTMIKFVEAFTPEAAIHQIYDDIRQKCDIPYYEVKQIA